MPEPSAQEQANDRSGERCNTLWIGPALGCVERACLRSMLRQGHPVSLYCYQVPEGVPEGVEICQASEILPEREIIRYRSGSVALFSNRFRYELLRQSRGLWIDADQYLVAPIPAGRPYLYGWQERGCLNSCVLRMPPDSPILPELLAIFAETEVPFWLPLRARAGAWLRLRRTGRTDVERMPWGSTGPLALSALAKRHGLTRHALAREVFCPVHYLRAHWILDPSLTLGAMSGPGTIGVHLWNEQIKHFKHAPAPPGSFLARLQAEGA